jgi:CRP-like cAMP-binding protein
LGGLMRTSPLGKIYTDGSIIVKQGDTGNLMYIILKGEVEVIREDDGEPVLLATLKKGDIFGEMALFSGQPRSATIRSKGETRVLTVDKRLFMTRVHEDPSFAFQLLKRMAERILQLDEEIGRLRSK